LYLAILGTTDWTNYPNGQVPTEAEFQAVLANLSALLLRAEFAGYDTAYLDNVVVTEASP
jgi:hypothetical protein